MDQLDNDDDVDAAVTLRDVARNLFNHLRESLGTKDLPDQEQGFKFPVDQPK